MKKFTIFLLTFLFFVGISNVNAHKPEPKGAPSKGELLNAHIVGPNEGCVGAAIILTAQVTGEDPSGLLYQWKINGQYTGVTTQTYPFTVTDSVALWEFTVEVSAAACDMVTAPVHYFQVLPKVDLSVDDNYYICGNVPAEVTAIATNFTSGTIWRYAWYEGDTTLITHTFINSYLFTTPGKYLVAVEMLNNACGSKLVPFEVIQQIIPSYTFNTTVTPNLTSCREADVEIDLSATGTIPAGSTLLYKWYKDGTLIPTATTHIFTELGVTAGTYTYTVVVQLIDAKGQLACEASDETIVTVVPGVNIDVTATESVFCLGGETDLSAIASGDLTGVNYLWTLVSKPTASLYTMPAGVTSPTFHFFPGDGILKTYIAQGVDSWYRETLTNKDKPGNYTFRVTVTNEAGCTDYAEFTITVNPLPELQVKPTILPGVQVCEGATVWTKALTSGFGSGSPGSGYEFTWTRNGITIPDANSYEIRHDNLIPGNYKIRAIVENLATGCKSNWTDDQANLTIIPPPIIDIFGNTLYCTADSIDIEITAMPIPANPQLDGYYQQIINPAHDVSIYKLGYLYQNYFYYKWYVNDVQIYSTSAPVNFLKTKLKPNPEPYRIKAFAIAQSPYNGSCDVMSEEYLVYVTPTPVVPVTISETAICEGGEVTLTAHIGGYADDVNYEWFEVGNPVAISNLNVYTVKNLAKGNYEYTFRATNIISGCVVNTDTLKVSVTDLPVLSIVLIPQDAQVCVGTQVQVVAIPDDGELLNGVYTWYRNGIIIDGATTFELYDILTLPGEYHYNATLNRNACFIDLDTNIKVSVEVIAPPTVTIEGPSLICEDFAAAKLFAYANPLDIDTYEWFIDGETTGITDWEYTLSEPARQLPYIFNVQVTYGPCTVWSDPFYVIVNPEPTVSITATTTTICDGGEAVLTAHIGDSPFDVNYEWYLVATGSDQLVGGGLTHIVTQAGTYYFKATHNSIAGCVATSNEITVNIDTVPVLENVAVVVKSICQGNQVTFTAPVFTGVTYNWFINGVQVAGAINNEFTPIFYDYGTFEVKVSVITDLAGCSSAQVLIGTITVIAAPSIEILGPDFICSAAVGSMLYTMTNPEDAANLKYQWFENGGKLVGETENSLDLSSYTVNPFPYNFVVQITDTVSGCVILSDNHPVSIYQFPTIGINVDKLAVCEGEIVTLSANVTYTENITFQWFADGDSIVGETAPVMHYEMDATTIFTFKATQIGSECVANSNAIEVVVVEKPSFEIAATADTICQGTQYTFNAPGFEFPVTYTWHIAGQIVPGANLSKLDYIFAESGIFEVKVSVTTDLAGCSSSSVLVSTITVKAAPQVTIEGPSVVCNAANQEYLIAKVNPIGAEVTYTWYEGITATGNNNQKQQISNVPKPTPYIYYVVITDPASGCSVTSEAHSVMVEQLPTIAIVADKTEICGGETVLLTANVDFDPNMIYQWYADGDTLKIPGSPTNTPAVYVKPMKTTKYTFTAMQVGSLCMANSNEIEITVIPTPVVVIQSIEKTICKGEQETFTATLANQMDVYYTWYINGTVQLDATAPVYTYKFNESGTFEIKVTATSILAGCTSLPEHAGIITVKESPTVTISGPTHVCAAPNPLYLQAVVDPLGATVTYQWFEDDNEVGTESTQVISNITKTTPYIYTVQIYDFESGCTVLSDPYTVYVQDIAPITITSSDTRICVGSELLLEANVEGLVNMLLQWYSNGTGIGDGHPTFTFNPLDGSYIFKLVATQIESGCQVSSNEITVIVDPMPDAPILTISDNKICSGDPVTISGNVEGDYLWFKNGSEMPNNTLQTIVDQPTANNVLTTYTYEAKIKVNTCTSDLSDPVSVVVHPTFDVEIFGAHTVCEQAVNEELLVLNAVLHEAQAGVSYRYIWTYAQGNNSPVVFFDDVDNSYAVVPSNLPANDAAAPYCFYVKVVALDYECTTTSACHQVDIMAKPTVAITVDNDAVCEGGVFNATAHVTPAGIVYNYVWKINGMQLAGNTNTISIATNLFLGVNEITVDVVYANGTNSCHGNDSYLVNVVGAPTLALTQDIEGLILPGMCVGGTVNLHSQIVVFDELLVDVNDFTYQWRRNGGTIANAQFANYSDMLNNVGTYYYEVRAVYTDNTLACNTTWTPFDPVKVVEQPSVKIAPKDYNYYDVCQGATIEVINTLVITDPNIQIGLQYKWNDLFDWDNFTTQIPPRPITFDLPGQYTYYLIAEFANPTCQPVKLSNELTYNVVSNPEWTSANVTPADACVGEEVVLEAEFVGGVTGTNAGKIQWQYNINGGLWNNVSGVGGYKIHVPTEAGLYIYRATYIASNTLTGCQIDPNAVAFNAEIHTATNAWFANAAAELPLHTCANNAYAMPVKILIDFDGTAPFVCFVKGNDGTEYHFTHYDNDKPYELVVTPSKTTIYTIESVVDKYRCSIDFVKSYIKVIVTDVEILTPFVEACEPNVTILLNVHSLVEPKATVTIKGWGTLPSQMIEVQGQNSILALNLEGLNIAPGTYELIINIDGCEFIVTLMYNYGNDGASSLIHRRWEGIGEVLAVSNNADQGSPYYNGGYQFTAYQWYKNGQIIPGATKQYYQDPNGVSGKYSVRVAGYNVVTGAPVEFSTCEVTFVPTYAINVYPVPAQIDQPVTIELDLTPAELEGAYLDVYDAKGAHVRHMPVVSTTTQVEGFNAQGTYFGRVTTGTNEIKTVKFIIVK